MDMSQLNFAALESGPIQAKGILKGGESFQRQVEVFLELLKDDDKTALLVGPSAEFTRGVPNYPNSLMGCNATELEHISGFGGLFTLAQKKADEVAAVLVKDPEFFLVLGRFLVCTPEIGTEITGDERFVGSSFGTEAFPTPLQANTPISHVFSRGVLGLLKELLTKAKAHKNALLKGIADSKFVIELIYRLAEIALCRVVEMEQSRKLAIEILKVMSAQDTPTRSLCFRTQMVDFALREAKEPSNVRATASGRPTATTARTPGGASASASASSDASAASAGAGAGAASAGAAGGAAEKCAKCGNAGDNMKRCARCLAVSYCGRDCQTAHWPTHKVECKKN